VGIGAKERKEMVIDGITGMAASEARIQAVMRALDAILDDPTGCEVDWETYLRRVAICAIEAGEGSGGYGINACTAA
jgi:hypothetical protein